MLSGDELASLLARTSRTFALAIPLLGARLEREVGLAYLLFRIADTLEDAELWDRAARLAALGAFADWIASEEAEPPAAWLDVARATPPTSNEDYLALLARADAVRGSLVGIEPSAARAIRTHVGRTARGMTSFVERQDERGAIVLADLTDLDAYCYAVAGIVGEMLTELFLLAEPSLDSANDRLRKNARAFGEALQLVNILKDRESDRQDGRTYVPESVPRGEVFARARADLAIAREYLATLAEVGASAGVRAFCELPVCLAEATLDRLEAGAKKLGRDETFAIVAEIKMRLGVESDV